MPEKEASGDFDYLWEKTDGSDGVDVVDHGVAAGDAYASEADLDYLLADDDPHPHDGFDAFDENTWDESFAPVASPPWYRSTQARTLLFASGTALAAIVVSVVLLVVKGSPAENAPTPAPSSTVLTTTTPLATATREAPPPLPPPPPPPPSEPAVVNEAPSVVRPPVRSNPSKAPEIGVTRTPVTRLPISVAPQPRHPR